MTTIDHQQAAIRAIAAALHGDACPADPDPGESCGCGDYEREALTQAWRVIDAGIRSIEKAANLLKEDQ